MRNRFTHFHVFKRLFLQSNVDLARFIANNLPTKNNTNFFLFHIQTISESKTRVFDLPTIFGTAFGLRLAQELNRQYDEPGTSRVSHLKV